MDISKLIFYYCLNEFDLINKIFIYIIKMILSTMILSI